MTYRCNIFIRLQKTQMDTSSKHSKSHIVDKCDVKFNSVTFFLNFRPSFNKEKDKNSLSITMSSQMNPYRKLEDLTRLLK